MIIPVRCFSCGLVIADKYEYYVRRFDEEKSKKVSEEAEGTPESAEIESAIRRSIFEELGLDRMCCRRMMLSHVDIINYT
jgi:DNA-directed RNA polymerase subunit N (RpoN/RPB10)